MICDTNKYMEQQQRRHKWTDSVYVTVVRMSWWPEYFAAIKIPLGVQLNQTRLNNGTRRAIINAINYNDIAIKSTKTD